jgi:hypothetical protein
MKTNQGLQGNCTGNAQMYVNTEDALEGSWGPFEPHQKCICNSFSGMLNE